MFGYVKPFKPELKICEFEAYKAVYCGLCGQLGKSYGPLARMTLSYDFTFLSMLHFSLSDETASISRHRCYVNPLKKVPCMNNAPSLELGADVAAIMLYYKLIDNIEDSKFIGRLGFSLLRPFTASARKKAAAKNPEADEIIRISMQQQSAVEAKKSASLDEAAEPTASAMGKLFMQLSLDEKSHKILERLGYCIGRFVYICDAIDDLDSDLKSGGYNPLIFKFSLKPKDTEKIKAAREYAKESVYMTIGEAAKAYDLLTLCEFRPILDNIIALGLRASADSVSQRKSQKNS